MIRIAKLVSWFCVAGFLASAFAPVANAFPALDQHCSLGATNYDLISDGTTPREQSFIPTQNRLEMVNMWWNGPGFAGDQSIKTSILNSSREIIGYNIGSPTFESEEPLIRNAEFSPALTLTPGETYYVQVDVLEGPHNLYWYYKDGDDCYANGTAYGEGYAAPWDFLFQTYGSTYTPPSTPSTPSDPSAPATTPADAPVASTTSVTTDQNITAVPKTTTSTSIAVPANPQVSYDDTNKAALFGWNHSATTDIEGYIISRSEDGTTFTDLGAVNKEITSYSDKNIANGKTYYYHVRAYKGTSASPVSIVASVTTPDAVSELAAVAVENPKESGFFTTQNIMLLLVLALAIILGILIYLRKQKNTTMSGLFKKEQKTE